MQCAAIYSTMRLNRSRAPTGVSTDNFANQRDFFFSSSRRSPTQFSTLGARKSKPATQLTRLAAKWKKTGGKEFPNDCRLLERSIPTLYRVHECDFLRGADEH
ncbi:hypothetical protein M758_10G180200 [Ceratodon purpureus]|uniref:Uncharacterized protein n=1 Tax=Ceratodon purpureus TaxID=3225 RepID=A0A8T0GQC5_CERPU|nr:hypothetical protein KC19_10G184600 [Ceratodon purpureus]KAG0604562.1 hypothetical protein M758_10G180200 [Ceratodon purpureus]